MNKKTLKYRSWTWNIVDVYATRDGKGFPINILLTLGLDGKDRRKKIFLSLAEVQGLLGCIVDLENPKKGLIGSKIQIEEIAKSVD